jgi:hypothetical protein
MSFDFWMGVGAGFSLGWTAACVMVAMIRHYDRMRGYRR